MIVSILLFREYSYILHSYTLIQFSEGNRQSNPLLRAIRDIHLILA